MATSNAQDDNRTRYGHADMNISCAGAAQSAFTRGLLQLHSFGWAEARASFSAAAVQDPECAMAHWGVAMSLYDGLHEPPTEKDVAAARAALSKAREAGAQSVRETAYIAAAVELFQGYPDVARIERDRRYSAALRAIADRYPEDEEAQIFYALSLLSLTRRGEDSALLADAAGILEPLFARFPEHPGIAHYLIHVYDDAGEREPGIEAARRYAGIAPLMTHAQHMPSHIFAGLGFWEESNASNAAALEADPQYYHALMYLVYGQLQLGRWAEARRLIEELKAFAGSTQGGRGEQRGLHLTNTWLLLETRDWKAAAEAPMYSDRALEAAETIYVRGLGAAQTGDLDAASEAVRSLETLLGSTDWANDTGLASRAYLLKIQALEIEALIALAVGSHAEAIDILQGAAELEDLPAVNRAPPDSGTGIPARELFGDVLLALGRNEAAAEQYRLALERTPNRLHSMLGLARALAEEGDTEAARQHYGALLDLLASADAGLAVVAEAKAYVEHHSP